MQSRMRFSPTPASQWSRFPATHPVTLKGDGLVYIELRPDKEIRCQIVYGVGEQLNQSRTMIMDE